MGLTLLVRKGDKLKIENTQTGEQIMFHWHSRTKRPGRPRSGGITVTIDAPAHLRIDRIPDPLRKKRNLPSMIQQAQATFVEKYGQPPTKIHITPEMKDDFKRLAFGSVDAGIPTGKHITMFGMTPVWDAPEFKVE